MLTAFAIAMTPMIPMQGAIAFAEDAPAVSDDIIEALGTDQSEEIHNFLGNDGPSEMQLPDAYDLSAGGLIKDEMGNPIVGQNVISGVKFQNPFGTCWGFAAVAASEGSIVSMEREKGIDADPNDPKYDLSEKHLAYFSYSAIDDENNSQNGEGIKFFKKRLTASDIYDCGGFSYYGCKLFGAGIGPGLESDFPYRGKRGKVCYIESSDGLMPYGYASDDASTLDEPDRFKRNYKLKESYMLPSPAIIDKDGNYEYNENGTIAIKQELMQGRPGYIAFCADNAMPNQEVGKGYISENWAHYTYDDEKSNHAVTIVGYDDNYSKENFKEGNQPPNDGAFLVKNSWGAETESFPNYGFDWGIENEEGKHTGYFWLSYYDKSLCEAESFIYEKDDCADYEINQYDFLPSTGEGCNTTDSLSKAANVFYAEENCRINDVAFEAVSPGAEANIKIIVLSKNYETPEDGVTVWEADKKCEYAGYFDIDLDEEVIIQSGQSYAVVVTQLLPNGKYAVCCTVDAVKEAYLEYDFPFYLNTVINEGESYVGDTEDGEFVWSDLTLVAKEVEQEGMILDNFSIKTTTLRTDENDGQVIRNINPMRPYEKLKVGGDTVATVTVSGKGINDLKMSKEDVKWYTSDPEILTVEQGDYAREAKVTAVGMGRAFAYAQVSGFGTVVFKYDIFEDLDKIEILDKEGFVYTGEEIRPEFQVLDTNGEVVPDSEYTAKYENNIDAGTAKIAVKPATGSFYAGVLTENFEIAKATQDLKMSSSSKYVKRKYTKKRAVETTPVAVSGANTELTYEKVNGSSKLSIDPQTGKIKVKRHTKKGKYRITVKATAAEDKNYLGAEPQLRITVTVK